MHITGLRDFEQRVLGEQNDLATLRTQVHQEFGNRLYPYDITGIETWHRKGRQVITMTVDCRALRAARSFLGFPAYTEAYNMHSAIYQT